MNWCFGTSIPYGIFGTENYKFMFFACKRDITSFNYTSGEIGTERVNCCNDLGIHVLVRENLSWSNHITECIKSYNARLY